MGSRFISPYLNEGDITIVVVVLIAIAAIIHPTPTPAQEFSQIAYAETAPMDGDFTVGPSSTELVPFEQVKAMIECSVVLGCDGHGDLAKFNALTTTSVCTVEDNLYCYSGVPWYRLEDTIVAFQDADVVLTQGRSKQILLAAN